VNTLCIYSSFNEYVILRCQTESVKLLMNHVSSICRSDGSALIKKVLCLSSYYFNIDTGFYYRL
jgi:hypothetical protein